MKLVTAVLISSIAFGVRLAQPSARHQHAEGVDWRGDHEMGLLHEIDDSPFLTTPGWKVSLSNDPKDAKSREEIQQHLGHIVTMFRNNDFQIPMLIHDRVPPGVPVMKKKRDAITYSYAATESGGLVRIKTANPQALKAIHEFLIFQIRDHRIGDPEEIKKPG